MRIAAVPRAAAIAFSSSGSAPTGQCLWCCAWWLRPRPILRHCRRSKSFASTLHFCLNVVSLDISLLRARREDSPLIIQQQDSQATQRYEREQLVVGQSLMRELMTHDWPASVRELANVAAAAAALAVPKKTLYDKRKRHELNSEDFR